jgi:hypothetical protein
MVQQDSGFGDEGPTQLIDDGSLRALRARSSTLDGSLPLDWSQLHVPAKASLLRRVTARLAARARSVWQRLVANAAAAVRRRSVRDRVPIVGAVVCGALLGWVLVQGRPGPSRAEASGHANERWPAMPPPSVETRETATTQVEAPPPPRAKRSSVRRASSVTAAPRDAR